MTSTETELMAGENVGLAIGKRTHKGHNMCLASGKPFWPLDPDIEDIHIEDIAHALSMQCRYNGHTTEFYSVAQHSVIVSRYLPLSLAFEGLLHDAAEAYCGDMIRPIKVDDHFFMEVDDRLDKACRKRFGLPAEMSPEVRKMDLTVCVTEKRDLIPPNPDVDWGPNLPEPLAATIVPVGPMEAKNMFLNQYETLVAMRDGVDS